MPTSRSWSRPATSGSCSGPASASVTSRTPASRRPISPRSRPKGRWPRPASRRPTSASSSSARRRPTRFSRARRACCRTSLARTTRGASISRRLFRLHLFADDRDADGGHRRVRPRAGGRRRRDVEHHRLHRPDDVRAVRRWRRAVVLSPAADDEPHIIDFAHMIDGSGGHALCMPAGGSKHAGVQATVDHGCTTSSRKGPTVFKFAVKNTEEIARRVLARNGLDPSSSISSSRTRRTAGSSRPPRTPRPRPRQVRDQSRDVRQHDRRHDPLALADARRTAASRRAISCCSPRSAPGSPSARCCCAGVCRSGRVRAGIIICTQPQASRVIRPWSSAHDRRSGESQQPRRCL